MKHLTLGVFYIRAGHFQPRACEVPETGQADPVQIQLRAAGTFLVLKCLLLVPSVGSLTGTDRLNRLPCSNY